MRSLQLALSAIAVFTLSACDSADNDTATQRPDDTATEAAPVAVEVHTIGQSVTQGGLEFTLTSVEELSKASDNLMAEAAGSGEVFIVARYAIKNLSTKPIDPSDFPDVELLDGGGTAYAEDTLNSALASDGGLNTLNGVNPGVTFQSAIVWRIAEGALDSVLWKIVVRADPAFEYRLK